MREGLECLELTRARLQFHTCAIVGSSGELKCWGINTYGQVRGRFVGRGTDEARCGADGFLMWL